MHWNQILLGSLLLLADTAKAAVVQQPLRSNGFDNSDMILDALSDLRKVVGGRLMKAQPVGTPCYPGTGRPSEKCKKVLDHWFKDDWITEHPSGYYYSNWASCQATGQSCALPLDNKTLIPRDGKCEQGSVPAMMVKLDSAATVEKDIQAAFDFSRRTKKPLVIKNTGHDWKGRSNAPDSLALWTHHLRAPIKLEKITLEGCSSDMLEEVIHFGAGEQWGRVYEFAKRKGKAVVGGTCPSVGVAGWLMGGGHSPLTPKYGLGVDNVRQVEVVIPIDGKKVIANACNKYKDLFKAIKGGGGGTYGVVTHIWYKTIPRVNVIDFQFGLILNGTNNEAFFEVLTKNALSWAKKGWGGYIMSNTTDHIDRSKPYGFKAQLSIPDANLDDAKADMAEFETFLATQKWSNTTWDSHTSWYKYMQKVMVDHKGLYSTNPVSRLMPRDAFSLRRTDLVKALQKVYNEEINVSFMLVTPTAFDHDATASALHSSWRDAIMSIRVYDKWVQFNDVQNKVTARSHFEKVHQGFAPIRELGADMGVSISEADIWEENAKERFWGNKYAELLATKKKYDPENLLTNYGAVNWNSEDTRFKCYPKQQVPKEEEEVQEL